MQGRGACLLGRVFHIMQKKAPEKKTPVTLETLLGVPYGMTVAEFCLPVIREERPARTALELMCARYCAYALSNPVFLMNTVHPLGRQPDDEQNLRDWIRDCQWRGLEVLGVVRGGPEDSEGFVEFRAFYSEKGQIKMHHEISRFVRDGGKWYYLEGRGARLPRDAKGGKSSAKRRR